MSCIITYKGQKYSEEQFKEYFINNKQEFTTSIIKNKDVIDSFKRKMEGIDYVFSQSPELASIGSKAQYLQYLSTIFKTSKVKDIVYHGTDAEFDKFNKELSGNKTGWAKDNKGIHFVNNKIAAETYTKSKEDGYGYLALWIYLKKDAKSGKSLTKEEFNNILSDNTKLANTLEGAHYFSAIGIDTITFEQYDKWAKLFEKDEKLNYYSRNNLDEILKSVTEKYKNKRANVKSVILNIKNPLVYDSKGKRYVHEIKDIYSKLKNENDGIIVKNTLDRLNDDIGFEDDIQVVFEPEQIHILGSKQDIEGFENFIKTDEQKKKCPF